MNRKKILILGAGQAQIDAIKKCKELGLFVCGCSYTNTDPGIPLLDDFRQIDIRDCDGVTKYAVSQRVDCVYSVGSDIAMPVAMQVSERMGLFRFISPHTAQVCQNKVLMRKTLGSEFHGNIRFIECSRAEDAKQFNAYPAMMKPVDSQGQRGCFRVDSYEDICEKIGTSLSFSKAGRVIIEEYIEGNEISVNAYAVDGKTAFSVISDRFSYSEYPGGIIKAHCLPSSVGDKTKQLTDRLVSQAIHILGIQNGPVYFQIKVTDDGEPKLIEVAPRLDGCHMWKAIKYYCGVDLLDALFAHMIEAKKPVFNPRIQCAGISLEFISQKGDMPYKPQEIDETGVVFRQDYYNEGDMVHSVNGYMEKCGYIIREVSE